MKAHNQLARRVMAACAVGLVWIGPVRGESADEQLWEAIGRGDLAGLREAIADGAEVPEAKPALLAAALTGRDLALVGDLLAAGADVERAALEGARPLAIAVSRQGVSVEMIQRLIAAGARMDAEDPAGGLVFHALRSRRDEVAAWLLENGAPVNRPGPEGRTELMELARREVTGAAESVELAKLLLAKGADPASLDFAGRTAGDHAAELGAVELLILLEPGNPRGRDMAALRQLGLDRRLATALRAHAASQVRWAPPGPPNQPGPQGEVIRALLAAGANPNAQVPSWMTTGRRPWAVLNLAFVEEGSSRRWCGDATVLQALLAAGARWDPLDEYHGLALEGLAGDADCLTVALAGGLSATKEFTTAVALSGAPDAPVKTTLAHAAARAGSVAGLRVLRDHGADLEARDGGGFTPVMRAVQAGREAAYQFLREAGVKMDGKTTDGRDLAALAAEAGHAAWVRAWGDGRPLPEWARHYSGAPHSRWLGEWSAYDTARPARLELRADGMGITPFGSVFAWREVEGGVVVRRVAAHPKLPGMTRAFEVTLLDDGEGRLVQKTEPGLPAPSVAGGFVWWRVAAAPFDPVKQTEALIARQSDDEVRASLASLKDGGSRTLYLSGPGRTDLPSEVLAEPRWRRVAVNWTRLRIWPAAANWPAVESVELANQDVLEIEPGALALPELATLEIRRARLRHLPLRLSETPRLRSLSLHDNRLTELPSGWRAVPEFSDLIAAGNRLRSLPSDLGEARSLARLCAGGNQLSDLPASLQNAPITSLALDDNRFVQVPAVAGALPELEYLSLAGNRLTGFPTSAGLFARLETLTLTGNRLAAVPDLRDSTRLVRLSLGGNRIAVLPSDDEWLPATVRELDLSNNLLAEVPAWLVERGFARLSLRGNLLPDAEARRLERAAEEAWRQSRQNGASARTSR